MVFGTGINYLVVLVAAIVSNIFGALWFGRFFGKAWAKEMGFSREHMEKARQKGMGKLYAISFVGTLIMAYVLAMLLERFGINSLFEGLQLGFWIWLGFFAATTLLGGILWEGKSFKLYLINALYAIFNLLIVSAILVVWR